MLAYYGILWYNYFDFPIFLWSERRLKVNQTLTIEQIISAIKQMPQKDRRIILSALVNSKDADIEVSVRDVTNLSESAFIQVWDNPEDAVYDDL